MTHVPYVIIDITTDEILEKGGIDGDQAYSWEELPIQETRVMNGRSYYLFKVEVINKNEILLYPYNIDLQHSEEPTLVIDLPLFVGLNSFSEWNTLIGANRIPKPLAYYHREDYDFIGGYGYEAGSFRLKNGAVLPFVGISHYTLVSLIHEDPDSRSLSDFVHHRLHSHYEDFYGSSPDGNL